MQIFCKNQDKFVLSRKILSKNIVVGIKTSNANKLTISFSLQKFDSIKKSKVKKSQIVLQKH
jgi:hypothetical protein